MNAFPAFIPLYGARIVVVGDGEAADAKARLVAGSPAKVVRATEAQALQPGLYDQARLVFIAVKDEALAAEATEAARAAGALVNVVDRQHLGDFHTPAIVDRSPVIAAISTGGAAPVMAVHLRNAIEARWSEGLGRLATLSGELQKSVRETLSDPAARRAFWRRLMTGPIADAAYAGDMETARRLAMAALDFPDAGPGVVSFLRAPNNPELLSLAAVRALATAERLVAGSGVPTVTLDFARREVIRAAAATAAELAGWAEQGLSVVCVSVHDDAAALAAVQALGAEVRRLPVAAEP